MKIKMIALATTIGTLTTSCNKDRAEVNKAIQYVSRSIDPPQDQFLGVDTAKSVVDKVADFIYKKLNPSEDVFVSETSKNPALTAARIKRLVARDALIEKNFKTTLKRYFDEDDIQMFLRDAKTPSQQILLEKIVKQNAKRGEDQISSFTLSMLTHYAEGKENLPFVNKLLSSKQINKKYYSDDAILEIAHQVYLSPDSYEAKALATKMLDKGVPEKGFDLILNATRDNEFKISALKIKKANALLDIKNKKTGALLSNEEIERRIENTPIPHDILFR